ncbi:putative ABC transport system ATP-binding protein [Reichenbachiella faecimaris]|uniref:Putative ABC transport system ATP-binding protein n=1 Tax=Reichenbachiella faecimaris TaxID=692418 RepID=A0A1W2GC13_REIFA|nr:ABC transporter ATP-binding protein [Reichenbachiella faecimaris]SMD34054.1 putative ABC transport system ATP-binding protein [Reichenbachiella faecimaris]
MSTILKVEGLSKTYQSGSKSLQVLHDISFSIQAGESLAIVGPSGSGKTTLLGLAAGLDQSDAGNVEINQIKLNSLSEDDRAQVRNEHVGFIFQNFQLIPTLSALENVMVPLELRGDKGAESVAKNLLKQVGLAERIDHYPSQLSGGEQQRVAIARAFSNEPKILFADEPTGNLDEETGQKIEDLLFSLNREKGTALVLVTHDAELAQKTDHVIHLKGGKMMESSLKASIAS